MTIYIRSIYHVAVDGSPIDSYNGKDTEDFPMIDKWISLIKSSSETI
jgi:hypothetical protein